MLSPDVGVNATFEKHGRALSGVRDATVEGAHILQISDVLGVDPIESDVALRWLWLMRRTKSGRESPHRL